MPIDQADSNSASPVDNEESLPEVGAPANSQRTAAQNLAELEAMRVSLEALQGLTGESRRSALDWLTTALGVSLQAEPAERGTSIAAHGPALGASPSDQEMPEARDFMSGKKPKSQPERIACLAFYLAQYRGTRHFKTADIIKLNTEAAGPKIGNPSRDVDNADRGSGYIVAAGGGAKQLTVRGEALVRALPDRSAVDQALKEHPFKAKRSSGSRRAQRSDEED